VNADTSTLALLSGFVPILLLALLGGWRHRGRRGRETGSLPPDRGPILPSSDSEHDAPSADQVYLDVTIRVLDAQVETSDERDSRVATAVSFGGTVLPVTIGLLNLGDRGVIVRDAVIDPIAKLLLGGANLVYGGLICFAYLSYRQRRILFGPNVLALRGHTESYTGRELRRWVAEEYARAVTGNEISL
jgi:hypothetical protein